MANKRLSPTIGKGMAACLLCLLIVACSGSDGDDRGPSMDDGSAIAFATDVTTRANTTIDSTGALQKLPLGIGVFAYLTEEKTWNDAISGKNKGDYPIPDFMFNQQLVWRIQRIEGSDTIRRWMYDPVKYWPNNSKDAAPRYISFFAYAPWQAESAKDYGIMEMPCSRDRSPHLKYKIGPVGNMTDLLYAKAIDANRNENGLIEVTEKDGTREFMYRNVKLQFHHALACVYIYIQRVYDEPHYSGKAPDEEKETKLFVSQLELVSSDNKEIFEEGYLDLATEEWTLLNSSGSDTDKKCAITYAEDVLNDSISGTVNNKDLAIIADRELNKWERTGFGIDGKERCLFKEGNALFFIPQELTLTPTLKYSMLTQDNDLSLSDYVDIKGNKYARIVHTVQGNSLKLNFEKGKRYKLLIHIEAEHIRFEVVSVTDWDFPLRFDTSVVQDFNEESKNHELNEH